MMRRFFSLFALTFAVLLSESCPLRADTTNSAPDFKEIYDLLRTNLPGATDETLNHAAVQGLLAQLHGQASIVSPAAESTATGVGTTISKSTIFESNVAYLRISSVVNDLADKLNAVYHTLAVSNKLAGTVLDLRFAGGDGYAGVPETVKLFKSPKNTGPIGGPLVVLINGETSDAAEVLAADLRKFGAALLIGSATAGKAKAFKEFPLKNGEQLRIEMMPATSGEALETSRVQPDIAVAVSPAEERVYFTDAYAVLSEPVADNNPNVTTNNFLPFIDHTSEADLVRGKLNESNEYRKITSVPRAAPQKRVVRDPILARALDLIKGLAVMRETLF